MLFVDGDDLDVGAAAELSIIAKCLSSLLVSLKASIRTADSIFVIMCKSEQITYNRTELAVLQVGF